MRRVLTIGLFSIFSIMMAGTVMAQERQVLQEGYSGIGTGRIGSGPGGGLDNVWMRNLLGKPETVYGRVYGMDLPGKKIYVSTGGDSIVTVELTDKSNVEAFRQVKTGDDVEIHIVADKAFMPSAHGSNDKRLLSMIVSKIYFD